MSLVSQRQRLSLRHEMPCLDLEVMSPNPGCVKLEVRSTSMICPKSKNKTKYFIASLIDCVYLFDGEHFLKKRHHLPYHSQY